MGGRFQCSPLCQHKHLFKSLQGWPVAPTMLRPLPARPLPAPRWQWLRLCGCQQGASLPASWLRVSMAPSRCRFRISLRPLHMEQGVAGVPGAAPTPAQTRQASIACTSTRRSVPSAASLKSSCSSACRSGGGTSTKPGPRAARPAVPGPARLLPAADPQRAWSYCCRCWSSDSTSKAWAMACAAANAVAAGSHGGREGAGKHLCLV